MKIRLTKIKIKHRRSSIGKGIGLSNEEIDWLIRQTEKVEKYEKALTDIAFVGYRNGDTFGNIDIEFSKEGHSTCIDIALDALEY